MKNQEIQWYSSKLTSKTYKIGSTQFISYVKVSTLETQKEPIFHVKLKGTEKPMSQFKGSLAGWILSYSGVGLFASI